jgi:hypothetical protein
MSHSCLLRPKVGARSAGSRSGGFALVIALSLMSFVLLLLLWISMQVRIEQVGAKMTRQKMEAEQAALLSLNLAIGKLQERAGLDQRVTAPAEALASVNGPKQLTGVWRSWEGSDHQANGLPEVPNYASKLNGGDLDIDAAPFGGGRFLGWLVSSASDPAPGEYGAAKVLPSLVRVPGTTVALVGEGSVGTDASNLFHAQENEVHLVPTDIDEGKGAYAWWISGENTKALLREKDDIVDALDEWVEWSERLSSSAGPDASEFKITDVANVGRVADRASLNLLDNTIPSGSTVSSTYFHDVTAYARGLLTNTANGGWRRDISLMSEQWGSLASPSDPEDIEFPFYTLRPGVETAALKNSGAVGGLIYPWAKEIKFSVGYGVDPNDVDLNDIDLDNVGRNGGASTGWGALVDFATQYKQIQSGSWLGNIRLDQKAGNQRDAINRVPVLARIHWVLSFKSKLSLIPGRYEAYMNLSPVFTYWNPYNVSMSGAPSFWIQIKTPFPYDFKFYVKSHLMDGLSPEDADLLSTLLDDWQDDFYSFEDFAIVESDNMNFVVPEDSEVWQPGEARVYSIDTKVGESNSNRYELKRGYEDAQGFDVPIRKNGSSGAILMGDAKDSLTVELQDSSLSDFTFHIFEGNDAVRNLNTLNLEYVVADESAEMYWPDPVVTNTTVTMEDVAEYSSPFMVMMVQLQNIIESTVNARGYSHKKPIFYGASNQPLVGDLLSTELSAFPFDMVIRYPNGVGGDGLPVDYVTPEDPFSFIGTSYRIGDGLKSLVAAELPTRSLRSLGDLQHFDVAAYNPAAPFVANPIGNSNASFMIEPHQVFINSGRPASQEVAYDHSYVANHLLFDDWFVSSIAPETDGYSSYPASEIRGIQNVYREFASGESPLPNTAYRPAEILSVTDANSAASDLIIDQTAWHHVASKLEVDGMFNVNSTSVEAWSAMLKHLREARTPYVFNATGDTSYAIMLEDKVELESHLVSRTNVAGDPDANAVETYAEIGTHMRLTDTQVEALATEIVSQVKERGPFLSLSEFMNRQLNLDKSGSSLALAGAVEAALVVLSTQGFATNPFSDLQATFPDVVNVPTEVSHTFPEAAAGNRAYGFPGWIRQADILRPLASVLSARDDTFVIRAYGESKNPITGETLWSAWCEAVVQRRADYVDPDDDVKVLPSAATLDSVSNERFGRRFEMVSFRWLSADEV